MQLSTAPSFSQELAPPLFASTSGDSQKISWKAFFNIECVSVVAVDNGRKVPPVQGAAIKGTLRMFHFWKKREQNANEAAIFSLLGHLEESVMEILWTSGESSVRAVADHLDRPLAYTTVMTTLDRLYKKGLLARRKSERAFLYSPKLSRDEFTRARAGDLIAGFLAGPQPSRELLVSCFLDAVGQHDDGMLVDLERKIRDQRKRLRQRRQR
jgi:predicted transcriptional regulator